MVRGERAKLARLNVRVLQGRAAEDRAGAADRSLFDDSRSLLLCLRYSTAASRDLHRSIADLAKLRKASGDEGQDEEPNPPPVLAPSGWPGSGLRPRELPASADGSDPGGGVPTPATQIAQSDLWNREQIAPSPGAAKLRNEANFAFGAPARAGGTRRMGTSVASRSALSPPGSGSVWPFTSAASGEGGKHKLTDNPLLPAVDNVARLWITPRRRMRRADRPQGWGRRRSRPAALRTLCGATRAGDRRHSDLHPSLYLVRPVAGSDLPRHRPRVGHRAISRSGPVPSVLPSALAHESRGRPGGRRSDDADR